MGAYRDFMKDAMIQVEEANERYEKDLYIEVNTPKRSKEEFRLENMQNLRGRKLREIDMCKIKITKLKEKINREREDLDIFVERIAYNYQNTILGLEKELKETDSDWIRTDIIKSLKNIKQGWYSSELDRNKNWLKHLYVEFKKWEDGCDEN